MRLNQFKLELEDINHYYMFIKMELKLKLDISQQLGILKNR